MRRGQFVMVARPFEQRFRANPSPLLLHRLSRRAQGQEKHPRAADEIAEAQTAVKTGRALILRLDDERERFGIAIQHAVRRVCDQRACQAPVRKAPIDRQMADQRCWQNRMSREAFDNLGRQIVCGHARRRERIVPGDPARPLLQQHEATRHEALHVLSRLFAEIAVERRRAAGKSRAIVRGERLDDEGAAFHRGVLIMSLRRRNARRKAAVGSGGSRMASVKAR